MDVPVSFARQCKAQLQALMREDETLEELVERVLQTYEPLVVTTPAANPALHLCACVLAFRDTDTMATLNNVNRMDMDILEAERQLKDVEV